MKKALVLAGGGTKGIYQAGVIEGLKELGKDDWNLITGTSVGALNAAMLVQGDFEEMVEMYENLTADQIIRGFVPAADMSFQTIFRERDLFLDSVKTWFREHGVDIAPFTELVAKYYDEERFFASDIDFGCITATQKGHDPKYVTKDMMKGMGKDWLIASAAATPVFPVKTIDGVDYVDGGYFDNMPVDFALRLGAQEIIAVDLHPSPVHPQYVGRSHITYIHPHEELHSFLNCDREKLMHAKRIGYLDGLKAFGRFEGLRYTFHPFELPSFFAGWYRRVMMLETRIKLSSSVSQSLRSDQYITDVLKDMTHLPVLDDKAYFFGVIDYLMEILGCDSEKVYDVNDILNFIMACFAECVDENYIWKPALDVSDLAAYARTLDRKGVIARMIHAEFYPEHQLFPETYLLTVHPFDYAAAGFIISAMKADLQEES